MPSVAAEKNEPHASGHSAPLGCALAYASQCPRPVEGRVRLQGGGSGLVPEEAFLVVFLDTLLSLSLCLCLCLCLLRLILPLLPLVLLLVLLLVLELELEQISVSANPQNRRAPSPQHHPSPLLQPSPRREEEEGEGFALLTCSLQRCLA